jgi:hypothetical protein
MVKKGVSLMIGYQRVLLAKIRGAPLRKRGDRPTGQYFMAVNVTKKEYVGPWDIGGLAKLWEWCVNRTAGIFPYLLRKSNEGGGGDVNLENLHYAGRWAGDEVYLVGDYDESNLWSIAESEYHNISKELAQEYNDFIAVDECKLTIK